MILVVLSGGIGSQLCQFAAGYSLAKERNCKLVLDASFFNSGQATKPFKLDLIMDISNKIIIKNIWLSRLLRFFFILQSYCSFNILKYSKVNIKNPIKYKVFKKAKNYFINGHANNMSYYEKYLDEILSKFNKSKIVSDKKTIGIHVRKGDQANSFMDFCDADYYIRSIKKIIHLNNLNIKEIKFLIFCEEIEWPKNNIKLDGVNFSYVIGDDNTATEDFKLMLNCSHLIIPNSYYSWWVAAYINNKKKGTIICPDLWWDRLSVSKLNLYPKNWTVLNTNVEINKNPEYIELEKK